MYRFDPDSVYCSSDFHMSHGNSIDEPPRGIIRSQKRPFSCVEEMDKVIIDNINKKVPPDATFIFCGDWCWHDRFRDKGVTLEEKACDYRTRINCKNIYFIFGNHDKRLRNSSKFRSMFRGCYDIFDTTIGDRKVIFSHYALKVWDGSRRSSWNIYAHSHNMLSEGLTWKEQEKCQEIRKVISDKSQRDLFDIIVNRCLPTAQTDVGIDTRPDYTVYSWAEVVDKIQKKGGDKHPADLVYGNENIDRLYK
jgi:calcineurin-like phosphoesterase family protein